MEEERKSPAAGKAERGDKIQLSPDWHHIALSREDQNQEADDIF